jgi:hypothetical protein
MGTEGLPEMVIIVLLISTSDEQSVNNFDVVLSTPMNGNPSLAM